MIPIGNISFISAAGGLPSSDPSASNSTVACRFSSLSSEDSYYSSSSTPEDAKEIVSPAEEMPLSSTQNGANGPASTSTSDIGNGPAPDFQTQTDEEEIMGNKLIDAINTLENKMAAFGHTLDIKLPNIAIIGPEDSGKSSVLNSFVGKDFLPSRKGLVTRRPTIIQFTPIPKGEEYGVFAHVPKEGDKEKRFYDFDAIRQEIEDETNRLLGPKSFSSEPIRLTIYSPQVLKLTVVDLPGIVKINVDDQDESIVDTVSEMVLEHIRGERTIILAVCPANQTLSSSDALDFAKKVDPNLERTIGVLTKLDLMDAGTNALKVLENQEIELKRGYVGVVNRSQKDIDENKTRADVLASEKKFFEESDCYSRLAYRMGSQYLQGLLQKTLWQHFKSELPKLREELSLRLAQEQRELKTFEETTGTSSQDGHYFYLMNSVRYFIKMVNVDLIGYDDAVDHEELSTGFYLNYILNIESKKLMNLNLKPKDIEVTVLIANLTALRYSVTVPPTSMNAVCQKQVNKFKDPLEKSLNIVKSILLDSVIEITSVMDKYPSLKNEVVFRIRRCITDLTKFTLKKLIDHCKAEQFMVNVGHPDFDSEECKSIAPNAGCTEPWKQDEPGTQAKGTKASKGTKATNEDAPLADSGSRKQLLALLMKSETNQRRTQYISQMITNYLEIVKKNMSDICFKYISYFLIKQFLDYLKEKLESDILQSSNLSILMQDCKEDMKKKAEMEAKCEYFEEALALIKTF